MRSKKKQPNPSPATPVYRAIPATAAPQAAPKPNPSAALRELNRYADDIQAFLRASRLRTLLTRVQADIDAAARDAAPAYPRLRRD